MDNQESELAKTVKQSKAPAISRAAAILRLLGKSDSALGLQAIARELELVPSTCLYVLRALVDEELVAFDQDTKRYSLEAGVLTLARQWLRRNQFADLAQPALDRLLLGIGRHITLPNHHDSRPHANSFGYLTASIHNHLHERLFVVWCIKRSCQHHHFRLNL